VHWYPVVKMIHMAAAGTSGTLFFLRGLAVNVFGARWPLAKPVRITTQVVDTILLTAAIALTVIIGQYPFVNSWLTVKVLLLVVYIALGVIALRPGRSAGVRLAAWLAALTVFAFIASVAVAHNPLGWFAPLS
jgi:uncharacterized membrane protein SirB2